MESLSKQLARRLKALRGDMPQMHFAKKLGISGSSLNRMELGQQNVSLRTLERLCRRLKCRIGDLFEDEDKG